MRKRLVVLGVVAALGVAGGAMALRGKPIHLESFRQARCVTPRLGAQGASWDTPVALRGAPTIHVSAEAAVGGLVLVRYPDGSVRHVTAPRDYIYPHDIRVASDERTLWIVTRGVLAGVLPRAYLHEYDVPSRVLVRELELDPEELPAPCR